MPYRVEIAPAAARDFKRLPSSVVDQLEPIILALAEDPRPVGVRKLVGTQRVYRIRVGAYRVIYEINDGQGLVVVVQVRRRTEATYRRR